MLNFKFEKIEKYNKQSVQKNILKKLLLLKINKYVSVFLKNKIAGLGRGVVMRLNALRALTHIHTTPLCVDRLCDRTQPGVIPSGSS